LRIAASTSHHGTAVDVDENGQILALAVGRGPDVQVQAVLALRGDRVARHGLRARGAVGGRIEATPGERGQRLGCLPAVLAGGGLRKGDAEVDVCVVLSEPIDNALSDRDAWSRGLGQAGTSPGTDKGHGRGCNGRDSADETHDLRFGKKG
jgi:hypothetical protein